MAHFGLDQFLLWMALCWFGSRQRLEIGRRDKLMGYQAVRHVVTLDSPITQRDRVTGFDFGLSLGSMNWSESFD
ncbi:unnamed protein product [Ilex paraguariensis]|uniref:Uncharacterized protein n=1 Tax=Ilex paraguariensis TaxID=185542 RepID=A0ABC8U190_9AQUA